MSLYSHIPDTCRCFWTALSVTGNSRAVSGMPLFKAYSCRCSYIGNGTVNTLFFPVFCSVISSRYLSPSRTISLRRSLRMSSIRIPRFASMTSAVATRSFGRKCSPPDLMVFIIFVYCSRVSAIVVLLAIFLA